MTPERWQQVEDVYHTVMARPERERAGAVAELCSSDEALGNEVKSLLGFLETPAHGGTSVAGERPLVGRRFGSYSVRAPLGAGGMGEVYRAHDERLGRDVAIKILPRVFSAHPERLARFENEARMLAALNHPHIGAIYGLEDMDGPALVLELVEGETLAERIAKHASDAGSTGPGLQMKDALTIARQTAEALEAAHERGIVHRDLKPANVKITPDGVVKVLDFGLAKLGAVEAEADEATSTHSPTVAAHHRTRAGMILGTVAYMSPEQAVGKAADKRSDLWAFGVVLLEMLTGRPVFPGETESDVLAAVLKTEPDLTMLPVETPAPILRLLRRCLEKDRTRRLDSASAARLEIDDALAAPDTERPVHVAAPSRRVALVVATLFVLAVGTAWFVSGPSNADDNPLVGAKFTRITDFPGDEVSAALSQDGKWAAFLSDHSGVQEVWRTQVGSDKFQNLTQGGNFLSASNTNRDVGFTSDGTEIWMRGVPPPTQRFRLLPLSGGPPRPLLEKSTIMADWSPDGQRMVFSTNDPGDPIFVADANGSNPQQIFVDRSGVHNHFVVWSTDGRWIYFVSGNDPNSEMDLWRIAVTGGQPERLTQFNRYIGYPTPIDARTVLYVGTDQDSSGPWLWALDVERNVARRVIPGLERYFSIAAASGGRRLIAAVGNPVTNLWTVPIRATLAEERDVKAYSVPTARALMPRFGGKSLFYLSSQGAGDGLWRFEDGQPEASQIWKGSEGALAEPPAISIGGQAVIVLRRNGKQTLQLISADGSQARPLAETIDVRGAASWSPDAKWIVTGGNDGTGDGLFKIPVDGGAPVRLATGDARNPVWSPTEPLIVYAGKNERASLPLHAVRPDGSPVALPDISVTSLGERIRFLPDGTGLIYMQGPLSWQDFWLLDLATQTTHRLSHLNNTAAMRTFDVSPGGKQIVFDRLRGNSDIVLIDLPR